MLVWNLLYLYNIGNYCVPVTDRTDYIKFKVFSICFYPLHFVNMCSPSVFSIYSSFTYKKYIYLNYCFHVIYYKIRSCDYIDFLKIICIIYA